jgi:hypothetical protein
LLCTEKEFFNTLNTTITIMSISHVPFSNYGILSGQLFLYASGRAAFESPLPPLTTADNNYNNKNNDNVVIDPSSNVLSYCPNKCILLGGLSDGLLPVPYTQQLQHVCQQHDWSLVQPVLSSSYTGFGHGSLQRDCDELQELLNYLITFRNGKEFALIGHSTGCQDVIYFMKHATTVLTCRIRLVVLQAPVSDREDAMQQNQYDTRLEYAMQHVQDGKGQEMLPRSFFWAPITAQRYVDLNVRGGTDDYFSSDFTDQELVERLHHVGSHVDLRVLVAFSGADEYVPSHVNSEMLTQRLVAAMNSNCPQDKPVAEGLYIPSGNHNLSEGPDDATTFVNKISEILSGLHSESK